MDTLPIKKRIKDMTAEELKEYKTQMQKKRREHLSEEKKQKIKQNDRESKRKNIVKMDNEEKIQFKLIDKDRKREDRRKCCEEEMDYSRIVDKHQKRRKREAKIENEKNISQNNPNDFLDWVEYYRQSEECTMVLKKRFLTMFEKCKDFVDANKEKYMESDEEEKITDYYERERERKQTERLNKSKESKDYENVLQKHKKRKIRREINKKDPTEADISEELETWFDFFNRNDETKNIMRDKNPTIYAKCHELKINKEIEKRKEMENKDRDKKIKDSEYINEEDECVCDYDVNCKFCSSIAEAEKGIIQYYKMTPEEEEENEVYKLLQRNLRKEKRQEIVRKSMLPLAPLPERELCEYEKIRENNIEQRKKEWAVKEAEWEAEWEKEKH